ncbi:hypothetical protein SBA4_4670012 [Candidatus Sulfopaludibacter sp. SbA4]|nr:hypothetical protein SBA4_4670012 [Candidatus Sulfopaludibacter sp. SbA4]
MAIAWVFFLEAGRRASKNKNSEVAEEPFHLFGGLAVAVFEEMPVRVHGELDRGVA